MKKLFMSYSWKNIKIADEIDESLKLLGITLVRDVRDAPNYTSLKNFMQRIRECDYAILLISDSYLRSENCMYEVIEFSKEADFEERILPILLDDATESRKLEKHTEYISFWESEFNRLQEEMTCVNQLNALRQNERLNKIREISQQMGIFLHIVSDIKAVGYSELINKNFKQIVERTYPEGDYGIDYLLKILKIENEQKKDLEFQKYIEKYGLNKYYYNIRGNDYYFSGKKELAVHYYEKVIDLDPNLAEHHNNLANALSGNNNTRAVAEYEKAIKLNPDYAGAYDDYAILLSSEYFNNMVKAKEYQEKALTLDSNNAAIHYNYANTLSKMGLHADAIKEYLTALRLNPDYTIVYNNLAYEYIELGDNETAFSYFDKMIESDLDDANLYFEFASFLCDDIINNINAITKGKLLKAKEYFERGFEIESSNSMYLCNYANLLVILDEHKKAKEYYSRALVIDPSFAKCHSNYAVLLKNSFNDLYKAKEHLEKAIELEPNEYAHHINYANLLSSKPFCDKEKSVLHYEIAKRLGNLRTSKKGKDRNKPCSCGSGLKYKNCCGK